MPPKIKAKANAKKVENGHIDGDRPKKSGKSGKGGKGGKHLTPPREPLPAIPGKSKVFKMLKTRGRVYQKFGRVFARDAKEDEIVTTFGRRIDIQTKAKAKDVVVMTDYDNQDYPVYSVQPKTKFLRQYVEEEYKYDRDDDFIPYIAGMQSITAIVMTPHRIEKAEDYGVAGECGGVPLRPYDILAMATSDMTAESCTHDHKTTCIPREAFYSMYEEPPQHSQAQMLALLGDDLNDALVYKKYKTAFARQATSQEEVVTKCQDGVEETTNTANVNDWILQATTVAKEQYVLTPKKFRDRYRLSDSQPDDPPEGYALYDPIGEVVGIKMTAKKMAKMDWLREGYFLADWGESMVCLEGDFLVAPYPAMNEVYRIALTEFWETYKKKETKKKKKN